MKYNSVGDLLANALANEETRELMLYRHNYESKPGVYNDYFDGAEYKKFKDTNLFNGAHDIALVMFVDGFVPGDKNRQDKLTIIHLLNMNIPQNTGKYA